MLRRDRRDTPARFRRSEEDSCERDTICFFRSFRDLYCSRYFVQLVFCGDFAFYYAKAMFLGTDHVELPSSAENLEM